MAEPSTMAAHRRPREGSVLAATSTSMADIIAGPPALAPPPKAG